MSATVYNLVSVVSAPLPSARQLLKLAHILAPYHTADLAVREYLQNFIHERRQKFPKLTFTPMDNLALWDSAARGSIGQHFT